MTSIPNSPEHRSRPAGASLEQIIRRDERLLTRLAAPGHALTPERMSGQVPSAKRMVEYAVSRGIDWPTRDSAVPARISPRMHDYFIPDAAQADAHFVYEAIRGRRGTTGARGFNNFSAILRSAPYKPESREDFQRVMQRNPSEALYGSKPYLLRAYLVAPEFMSSLQQTVAECGGSSEWHDALMRGGLEADIYPKDAALTRGSRLAYGLLANLMRTDDLARQSQWLGFKSSAPAVSDPETELWT